MSDLESIHIRQLAYLDAVANAASFGDAADALGVSQPALSQGIARLETIVGSALFESVGRGKRMTSLGRELAEYAARILGETRALGSEIEARREGRRGTIRVGMIDAALLYLLEQGIADFRDQRPEVELRLTVGDSETLAKGLVGFDHDLVYVVAPVVRGEYEIVAVEPLYIYGPPLPRSTSELECVLYPDGSHTRAAVDAALAKAGIVPTVAGESSNPLVLRQFVQLGMGWTVLPKSIAETGPNPLARRSEAIGEREICAAWRTNSHDDVRDAFRHVVERRPVPATGH